MVHVAKDIVFMEAKKLPTHETLQRFGISFNTSLQQFEESGLNLVYHLKEFINDYYKMDYQQF
jgi:hypothetical protein